VHKHCTPSRHIWSDTPAPAACSQSLSPPVSPCCLACTPANITNIIHKGHCTRFVNQQRPEFVHAFLLRQEPVLPPPAASCVAGRSYSISLKAHSCLSWHSAHAQSASWSCSSPLPAPCCSWPAPLPTHCPYCSSPGCQRHNWYGPGPHCSPGCAGIAAPPLLLLLLGVVQTGSAAEPRCGPGGQGTGT
jgi:hypothetical protein